MSPDRSPSPAAAILVRTPPSPAVSSRSAKKPKFKSPSLSPLECNYEALMDGDGDAVAPIVPTNINAEPPNLRPAAAVHPSASSTSGGGGGETPIASNKPPRRREAGSTAAFSGRKEDPIILARIENRIPVCAHCNANDAPAMCSLCFGVSYCNSECQLQHWDEHNKTCSLHES